MKIRNSPRVTDGGKFTNKMEDKKITFEQFCDKAFIRSEQMKVKSEVVWVAFLELDGLINTSKLARKYFDRSPGWFAQKLHGNEVCNKERAFRGKEYTQLSAAFRDIALRLNEYADAIDMAEEY